MDWLRAAEDQSFFAQILFRAPEPILAVNDAGLIVYANQAARQTFESSGTVLNSSPVVNVLPDWYGLPSVNTDVETTACSEFGGRFPADVSSVLAETSEGLVAVIVIRDVTRRKALKERTEIEQDVLRGQIRELREQEDMAQSEKIDAAEVLESYLPQANLSSAQVEIAWHFAPCRTLGGDMLRVHRIADGRYLFCLLDVSGHGTASALLSVNLARSLTPRRAFGGLLLDSEGQPRPPSEVMAKLNRNYQVFGRSGHFVTMIYGVLDPDARLLRYSCAGHPHPIRLSQGKAEIVDGPIAAPVGITRSTVYPETKIKVSPGDRFLFYTDGITETRAKDGELYDEERLVNVAERNRGLGGAELLGLVMEELATFGHGPPADDVTALFMGFR